MSEQLFENGAEVDLQHSAWTADISAWERLAPKTLENLRAAFDGTAQPGKFVIKTKGTKQWQLVDDDAEDATFVRTVGLIELIYDDDGSIIADVRFSGDLITEDADDGDEVIIDKERFHQTIKVPSSMSLETFLEKIDGFEWEVLQTLGIEENPKPMPTGILKLI